MSKKKRNASIWDVTPEEQEEAMDALFELEQTDGNTASLFSLINGCEALDHNGLSAGIEAEILKGIKEDRKQVINPVDYPSSGRPNTSRPKFQFEQMVEDDIAESAEVEEETNEQEAVNNVSVPTEPLVESLEVTPINMIRFRYDEVIDRIMISNGRTESSFNCSVHSAYDIIGCYDNDDINDKIEVLTMYIYSLQFPAVIYRKDDFVDYFAGVKKYNDDKFIFFTLADFVIAYIIDTESYDEIRWKISSMANDRKEELTYWIGLAYGAGILNNAFITSESLIFQNIFNAEKDKSELFYNIFAEDEDTTIFDDDEEEILINLIDLHGVQNVARKTIVNITGEYEDDDEYDEDLMTEVDEEMDRIAGEEESKKLVSDDIPQEENTELSEKLAKIDAEIEAMKPNKGIVEESQEPVEMEEGDMIGEIEPDPEPEDVNTVTEDVQQNAKKPIEVITNKSDDDDMIVQPILKKR